MQKRVLVLPQNTRNYFILLQLPVFVSSAALIQRISLRLELLLWKHVCRHVLSLFQKGGQQKAEFLKFATLPACSAIVYSMCNYFTNFIELCESAEN